VSGMSPSFLSAEETRTLEAICLTLVPTIQAADDAGGLMARSASDLGVARLIVEVLAAEPPETRAQFRRLLGLFGSPIFGLLAAGRPKGFASLSPRQRERALLRMSTSSIPLLRQAFQAVKRPAAFLFYAAPDSDDTNPNWPAIRYEPTRPPQATRATPKPIRTVPITKDVELTADVVVIGSGAGGSVVAAELAAAGSDVVVLEMGEYLNEADFTGMEAEMTPRLFLGRGLLSTSDLGIVVLAGSCLGGGTVVNWSDSLRTPADVLDEWEAEHGLEGVTAPAYQQGFELAERRMGVNILDSVPNENNAALRRGCEALGYHWDPIPRNASGCEQRCGGCQFGCPYGRKQTALLTFLQDAHDRGARIVSRCRVQRVLVSGGRATGVEARVAGATPGQQHRLVVRAQTVVVAGGGVESPAVLLRSGLDNPNIGRHLRLHPVTVVAGFYDHPVQAWTGSPQTVKTDQFAHLRGAYGFRLEMAPAHPGIIALGTAWDGGRQHKLQMLQSANAAVFFVLSRDTGEGRVQLDRGGRAVLSYWPDRENRDILVRGMQEIARIAFAGGAVSVSTTHSPTLQIESEGRKPGAVSPARLERFLGGIADQGVAPNRLPLFTAHQMGSCRLGASSRTSVADPYGQVHGVSGLYVADASGFPTASGVNPMLSVMALAYRVAQRIKAG
jgi:choline dehydrogenase-like flavoprotein